MYDIFTAILLADNLSRRHFEQLRRTEPQPERESPWARVMAWHRHRTDMRA